MAVVINVVWEAPTSRDAIELAGLNWSVNSNPIYDVFGNEIKGFKANTRSSDNSVLGVVTDKYKIVQNIDAFDFTDNLIGEEMYYETAGSLRKGKTIWLLGKMPERYICEDKFDPYIVFTNTHDGTGAVKIAMTPIRVVCNNTLNMALSSAKRSWSTKHMGNMEAKLSEARHTLELANDYLNNLAIEADKLANETMKEEDIVRLTKVDKVNSPVLMYSERFLTKERVLESHTPPDIDNNVSEREPFIQAQKELVGELGTYDLIALGTLKLKAAWKMFARANGISPETANEVSKQLASYELAKKHAEENEEINMEDYVDSQYKDLVKGCQKYLGIYDNIKGHPCATIAYDGDVESDIGIVLCKSEATGNKVLTAVIESGTIDDFGYLKQDYLIVDSIGLTYDIYKEIGIKPYSVNQLLEKVKDDKKVWDIYANGFTQCVNQCEQPKSTI